MLVFVATRLRIVTYYPSIIVDCRLDRTVNTHILTNE